MNLFLFYVMFLCQERSFLAKTAVMLYILSLCWLKISTLVVNSCISNDQGGPENNGGAAIEIC